MPDREYTAEIPHWVNTETIEALRELGGVYFVFKVDAPSRADAVAMLGDEYGWRGFDRTWWDRNLSGRRIRKSEVRP